MPAQECMICVLRPPPPPASTGTREAGRYLRSQRVAESSAGTAATAPPFTSAPDVYERFCCSNTSTIGSTHHGDRTARTVQAQSQTQLEEGRKNQLDGSAGSPLLPEREDDLGMGSLQPVRRTRQESLYPPDHIHPNVKMMAGTYESASPCYTPSVLPT
ncbi:hypothetical protein BKA70DRAFT_1452627 [Coprinopsis sp. MPI-PUGE-AT-0042]|nr:hypothetical protein BKA70DRAFT_1452627 [Coprinopsis sp. MPI-PUGE-AT-0042]